MDAVVGQSVLRGAHRRPVGRPRNEELDALILQAVREILVERGYAGLTVKDVTERCGVDVRTITRRWDTKAELVAAAVLSDAYAEQSGPPPSGDLRADLRQMIEVVMAYLARPACRVALPALWSETQANPAIRMILNRREKSWTREISLIIEQAIDAGSAPPGARRRAKRLPHFLAGTALSIGSMELPDSEAVDDMTEFIFAALVTDSC